jgi:hypothetical protein
MILDVWALPTVDPGSCVVLAGIAYALRPPR